MFSFLLSLVLYCLLSAISVTMSGTTKRWFLFLLLVCLLVIFLELSPSTSSSSPSSLPSPRHWSLERPAQCSAPVEKFGFLKTHKTAGSTVQNILLRWGLTAGLNFVLPPSGNHLGPPDHPYQLTGAFSRSWYSQAEWSHSHPGHRASYLMP